MRIIEKILLKFGYKKIDSNIPDNNINYKEIFDDCIDIRCESESSFHFHLTNTSASYDAIHKLQLKVSEIIYEEVLKNMDVNHMFDQNKDSQESKIIARTHFKLYPMIPKNYRTNMSKYSTKNEK